MRYITHGSIVIDGETQHQYKCTTEAQAIHLCEKLNEGAEFKALKESMRKFIERPKPQKSF